MTCWDEKLQLGKTYFMNLIATEKGLKEAQNKSTK